MKIAIRAAANNLLVAADDSVPAVLPGYDASGTVIFPDTNRPLIARSSAVGLWEMLEMLTEQNGAWVPFDFEAAVRAIVAAMTPIPPIQPQPPSVQQWSTYPGTARSWFEMLVYGKPFGQQTLLALEPVLNANGWQLTPPNAVGDRTKVLPGGQTQWVRVGFGEGYWVWVVQG